jgi:lauroyl/myristoyl acyltransferase
MKEHIKSIFGLLFFYSIRWMERRLSVDALYRILYAFSFPRAAINCAFKRNRPLPPLPEIFYFKKTGRLARQQRVDFYLDHLLDFFQDRLAEPKWMSRCHVEGFEPIQEIVKNKRPIVIAVCHFGPYYLSRMLVRALGLPVMELLGGKSKGYTKLMQVQDRHSPFPDVPPAVYQDELRKMAACLAAGNALGIAIDTPFGKQMDISFSKDWIFQMATGAVRIAINNQADVIPLSIVDEGRWRFRLKFGRPVPHEFLADNSDWTLAGKHILDEMIPHFKAHPDHCLPDLTRCLKPVGQK